MQTDIIIQARIWSSRLPWKTMLSLAGKEVLWHVVERCKYVKNADNIIVATTTESQDDIIERFCIKHSVKYFRWDEKNVLKRYYDTAKKFSSDNIVRITSDCPLIDPQMIYSHIEQFEQTEWVEYISNCLHRTFPRWLDCEVFSFDVLEQAYNTAKKDFEKEHVTQYIMKNMNTQKFIVDAKYESDVRITLDQIEDYQLISCLYDKFYTDWAILDTRDMIDFLKKNKEIAQINKEVEQKKI